MSGLPKGQRTRAEIVQVADTLFQQHGFDGTSFSRIVEASGLQRGNIYHYFKSKDEILHAVVERRVAAYHAQLTQWQQRHTDPCARLHAFVVMIAGERGQLVEYGCPIGTLNSELGKDRRDLQQAARALFDLFREWLAGCFSELGYGGEAKSLALHLLGRAQGIAVITHVYRDEKLLRRELKLLEQWIDEQCAGGGK